MCIPEIYNSAQSYQWAYQKKWAYAHGLSLLFTGLMSENGWGNDALNQTSYNYFTTALSTAGYPQSSFTYQTWMALDTHANP